MKDAQIATMQKGHKSLQEKYFKLINEKRRKPQQELLNQAKEMKNQKMERERMSQKRIKLKSREDKKLMVPRGGSQIETKRNISKESDRDNTAIYAKENDELKNISDNELLNIHINPNITNVNNQNNSNTSGLILPMISSEKSISNIKKLNISENDVKLDEINNMMKQIIDEF